MYYNPRYREQIWRFFTYMFVHDDVLHLVANLFLQLLLGTLLEYSNSWWRLMIVYFAGGLSGSLGASVILPNTCLIGASAGVNALVAAFIPTIILNWKQMKQRALYILMFLVTFSFLIIPSLLSNSEGVSHTAHICGAIAGLLVGFVVLRDVEEEMYEIKLKWFALGMYVAFVLVGILLHVFITSHFP